MIKSVERRGGRRTIMNDKQIHIMVKALLDQNVSQRRDVTNYYFSFTPLRLRNWLSNRKAKLARPAAKDTHMMGTMLCFVRKQTGSGPDSNSPENLMDEDYDPSPSVSQLTHEKDRRDRF